MKSISEKVEWRWRAKVFAFQSDRAGNQEIYAVNPDGTNPVRLTNNGAWEGDPTVSPDGKRIAFVTDRHGGSDHEELYVIDARYTAGDGDGGNQTRLTNNTTADYDPDWGPVIPPPGCTIVGTAGKDVIPASQSPGDDQVDAGAGDDTVKGGGGADTLVAGTGSDKVYGEAGGDTLNVKDGVMGNDLAGGDSGTDSCTRDKKDKLMNCP